MPSIGLGLSISRRKFRGGFDSSYQAVLNYATTQGYNLPSRENQKLQNDLIVGLKDEGIWNLIDHLQVYPNDATSGSDFATINWINPNGGHNAIRINSPNFSQYYGFSNADSTQYVNTNVNLATDSTNFTLSSNSISVGIRQDSNSTKTTNFGARLEVTSTEQIAGIPWAGVFRYLGTPTEFPPFSLGFFNNCNIQGFSDGSVSKRYKDGVVLDTITLSDPIIPNYDFWILALNNGGTPQFQGANGHIDHFMSGSGDINLSTFNTLISDYKTAILSL